MNVEFAAFMAEHEGGDAAGPAPRAKSISFYLFIYGALPFYHALAPGPGPDDILVLKERLT